MKLLKPDNEPSHHTTLELFAKKPQLVGLCEIFYFFLSVPLTHSPWKFCQKTLLFTSGAFFWALSSQKEANLPKLFFAKSNTLLSFAPDAKLWLLKFIILFNFFFWGGGRGGGQKRLTVSDSYMFCTFNSCFFSSIFPF